MIRTRLQKPLLLVTALLASAGALGCEDIETFIPLPGVSGPAGVIEGTVTYTGPPPCMRGGHVVGAAIILAFDTRLLPPPDGLGSSAASIDAVSGDELFAGIRAQLPSDGCPAQDAAPVTVSASWGIAPLPGGSYQIRGFYDYDGDFDPTFSISNLPTRGDVGGGAIENAAQVLTGAAAVYREIPLGQNGKIPEQGARISGVAVTLGLTLPVERPVFHVAEALTPTGNTATPPAVTMAADYQLPFFRVDLDPMVMAQTEQSFLRLRLAAGVPAGEAADAARSPFFMPVGEGDTPSIFYAREDVNRDGVIDGQDHVPDSAFVPSLFPLSVFRKIPVAEPDPALEYPTVVIQGLTLYESFEQTVTGLGMGIPTPAQPEALVAVRPSALCLYPANPAAGGVLVVPHLDDSMGNTVVSDPDALGQELSARFGRTITVQQGCLPEGNYAINLIYGTGQAWTVPNEGGVCAETEEASADRCGTRRRLASQGVPLQIAPPGDAAHCTQFPTPALCLPRSR